MHTLDSRVEMLFQYVSGPFDSRILTGWWRVAKKWWRTTRMKMSVPKPADLSSSNQGDIEADLPVHSSTIGFGNGALTAWLLRAAVRVLRKEVGEFQRSVFQCSLIGIASTWHYISE